MTGFGDAMVIPTPPVLTGDQTIPLNSALQVLGTDVSNQIQAMEAQGATQGFLNPTSVMAWLSQNSGLVYVGAGLFVAVIFLLPPGRRRR